LRQGGWALPGLGLALTTKSYARSRARATPTAFVNYPGYIANNAVAIVNYSERWRNGERISTAFVESTVNRVVSQRFAKKQQMQWSKAGAHLLLQTRTKTLDGTLRDLFTRWYPGMSVNDNQVPALAMAA
jgi:hypothetical protein